MKIFPNLFLANVLTRSSESQATSHTSLKKSKSPKRLRLGWSLMLLLAVFLFVLASRYLSLNPDTYFPEQKLVYMAHTTMLLMHILGAMAAIIMGPFQFLEGIRKGRWLKIHRWLGRVYLLGVLFGGFGGLYMARLAYGGLPAQLGFGALGLLWLFTGWMAYILIRNKEIERHREWMIRNYALTFAGVMLRLWLPLLTSAGLDFTIAYITVAWLCWIPNLFVAQWLIQRNRFEQSSTNVIV